MALTPVMGVLVQICVPRMSAVKRRRQRADSSVAVVRCNDSNDSSAASAT